MSTALWPAFTPVQPYNPGQRSGLARKRLNLAPPASGPLSLCGGLERLCHCPFACSRWPPKLPVHPLLSVSAPSTGPACAHFVLCSGVLDFRLRLCWLNPTGLCLFPLFLSFSFLTVWRMRPGLCCSWLCYDIGLRLRYSPGVPLSVLRIGYPVDSQISF